MSLKGGRWRGDNSRRLGSEDFCSSIKLKGLVGGWLTRAPNFRTDKWSGKQKSYFEDYYLWLTFMMPVFFNVLFAIFGAVFYGPVYLVFSPFGLWVLWVLWGFDFTGMGSRNPFFYNASLFIYCFELPYL